MSALGERGPVTVVGAGPAGALMALYLARQGHEVRLFESRPDLRRVDLDAGRSINLALATRGLVALEQVGLAEAVRDITIPMAGRMVHAGGETSFQPYGTREDEVIYSVSRPGLNAILLDAAEATGRVAISFGHRCREADFDEMSLRFTVDDQPPSTGPAGSADGGVSGADLGAGGGVEVEVAFGTVLGCDGASSVVRACVQAAGGGSSVTEPLDHGYKELTIAPADGGGFRIEPNALHIWPRGELMLIALPNPAGDFTATLFMPLTGGSDSFEAMTGAAAVDELFQRHFEEVVTLLGDPSAQFEANPTGHLATIRATGWSLDDRAVVVGDAAHAIVPFHGQGMNLAMESCRLLDQQLRQHPGDAGQAFRAFEAGRKPDADAIADMALDNYLEMRAGVVDPEYLLRRELALELERRHPDRVAARYGMVMFTTMPYAAVKERAERQQAMFAELTRGATTLADVDLALAADRAERLGPLPEQR